MLAKLTAAAVGLFALTQAVLLALFLSAGDDRGRFTARAVDAIGLAVVAGLAAVVLWVRPLRNRIVRGSPDRRRWRVLGLAAALMGAGEGLRVSGLLMAGPGPLNGWQVAGHVVQEVGMGLVAGFAAVALWQTARRPLAADG